MYCFCTRPVGGCIESSQADCLTQVNLAAGVMVFHWALCVSQRSVCCFCSCNILKVLSVLGVSEQNHLTTIEVALKRCQCRFIIYSNMTNWSILQEFWLNFLLWEFTWNRCVTEMHHLTNQLIPISTWRGYAGGKRETKYLIFSFDVILRTCVDILYIISIISEYCPSFSK